MNYKIHISEKPCYDPVREEIAVCETDSDFINFAFYCLNRSETSKGEYRRAYFTVASKIYTLFTNKKLSDGFKGSQK